MPKRVPKSPGEESAAVATAMSTTSVLQGVQTLGQTIRHARIDAMRGPTKAIRATAIRGQPAANSLSKKYGPCPVES